VRRWLDPRTQAKIEILGSGPETHQRLQEFIPPEYLPMKYGGMAPDLSPSRQVTEFAQLSRLGSLRRDVAVPAGRCLVVDSYVPEGELVVEVYCAAAASPAAAQAVPLLLPP
jgi:hypothetical protein